VSDQAQKARRLLELHQGETPLLLVNAWDRGSAKLLASRGFDALATTSSGFAATLGRLDGTVTREEALTHAAEIVSASELPVSADLEDGFAKDPAGVAETVAAAIEAGLAGCSIEDYSGEREDRLYELEEAVERVEAAAEAAHSGPVRLVLTARAENYLHGRPDLADTIARLQAFERAGADVLYAPGPTDREELRAIVEAVGLPVNVLVRPGAPSVAELAAIGVRRISVGGAFAFAAFAGLVEAASELREQGTYGFLERSGEGLAAVRSAFG
jgi:2-methylisocitrate lyase-like PEP mutase family enzyme